MIWADLQADARAPATNVLRASGETLPPLRADLVGSGAADTLIGDAGDDSLSGGAGDDLLSGGGGANFLDGGVGIDTVTYASATEGVTASLAANSGRGGADTLFGIENLVGSAFSDHLTGNGLDNTLTGGAGQDTLAGGAGADLFVFGAGHASTTAPDMILDWSADDRMTFFGAGPGAYQETSAPDAGLTHANSLMVAGARYLAVETPTGVILYVDTNGQGTADEAVLLSGRTLADISATNVGSIETLPTAPMGPPEPTAPPPTPPPTPPITPAPPREPPPTPPPIPAAPALPSPLATTHGQVRGNMETAQLADLLDVPIVASTSTHLRIDAGAGAAGPILDLVGTGFVYDSDDQLRGGTVREIIYVDDGGDFAAQLFVTGVSAEPFLMWVLSNATQVAFSTILAGNDRFGGSVGADLLHGYNGHDHIGGAGGDDTIFGGLGNDQIFAMFADPGPNISTGSTYLRGDDGDDYIVGANGFDDINGNRGADTAIGGVGDDWVVGGKHNDLLFGDAGHDLVYGNLGDDTCIGGAGNDIVRGGQNDDYVFGGDGDDYVSGDKGDDTVTGGSGADLFHTFGDAGIDRVTDFNIADGDRVLLDPGTQYTVAQIGGDTVISMTGGGQMNLVGVQLAGLPDGWIFGA